MRWVLLAFALLWLSVLLHGQRESYTLAIGRFGGTDQELQECYFGVGQGAMLTLHPKGEPCQMARDIVGRTGRLVFIADGK